MTRKKDSNHGAHGDTGNPDDGEDRLPWMRFDARRAIGPCQPRMTRKEDSNHGAHGDTGNPDDGEDRLPWMRLDARHELGHADHEIHE